MFKSDGKDFFLMEKPLTGNCVVFFPFQFDGNVQETARQPKRAPQRSSEPGQAGLVRKAMLLFLPTV